MTTHRPGPPVPATTPHTSDAVPDTPATAVPDLAPGTSPDGLDPLDRLRAWLHQQHLYAGEPSYREISRRTARAVSHTTVSKIFKCEVVPAWGHLELVVEALGGDTDDARRLRIAARTALRSEPSSPPTPVPGPPTGPTPDVVDLREPATGTTQTRTTPATAAPTCADHEDHRRTTRPAPPGEASPPATPATVFAPAGDPLTGHTHPVLGVAFSPDGTLLATTSADQTVRLWNPATGQPVREPLTGHTNPVWGVAFSPDGTLLATTSHDRTVRLWNPAAGQPVGDLLNGHTGDVWGVAFSPDGHLLATTSNDKTARLWLVAAVV